MKEFAKYRVFSGVRYELYGSPGSYVEQSKAKAKAYAKFQRTTNKIPMRIVQVRSPRTGALGYLTYGKVMTKADLRARKFP